MKINFQPDAAPIPSGYNKDIGAAFSDAAGFGWVTQASLTSATHDPLDISPNTRDRNANSDQRLDTLAHMQGGDIANFGGVTTAAAWEYALLDGTYTVTVAVGDAKSFKDPESYTINVEGVTAISGFVPTGANGSSTRHKIATVTVPVSDGRLTIDAIGGTNTKLDYVEITNDLVPPAAPAGLTASGGNSQVLLDWADNSESDLGGYNVYRSTNTPVSTGSTPLNGATPVGLSTYTDTTAQNGTIYHYVVTAVDTAGNASSPSNEVTAMPDVATAPTPAFPFKVNFQNQTGAVPAGYTKDYGQNYANVRGFGWVVPSMTTPLDLVGNGRERNVQADQRLDTLMHMQANDIPGAFNGVKKPGAWELAVPNGGYSVTVAVGDPKSFTDPENDWINVEGVTAIDGFIPSGANGSSTRHKTATVSVSVGDGRLTIDAIGGTNTRIDYLEVSSQVPPEAPSNLVATPSDGQVGLNWADNSESDLAGYNVYRGTTTPVSTSGTPLNGGTPLTASDYADLAVQNGTIYYYVVKAVDLDGNSSPASQTVRAMPDVAAPPAPVFPVNVNFQSDGVPIPTGYAKDHGENYANVRGFGWVEPGTSIPLSLVGNGRDRNVNVDQRLDTLLHMQASDIAGNFSGVKQPGSWQLAVPNGTYAVTVAVGDAKSGSDPESHTINVEGVNAISGFVPSGINGSSTRHLVADVVATVADGKLTIDAIGGTNTKIDYVEITDEAVPPSAPASLVATAGDAQVVLDWADNTESDLLGYNVYRSTTTPVSTAGTPLNGATLLTESTYTDTTVVNGTLYYYVVTAVDADGNSSSASNEVSALPDVGAPPVPTFPVQINFQNETGVVPTGYTKDFGQSYANSRGFGWVVPGTSTPLSLVGNGRDRNSVSDQRLDTLMHMQANDIAGNFNGVKAAGAWELGVPSGGYSVTVSVGDASALDSIHRINIEGQTAIYNFTPLSTELFASVTRTINVADGELTIDAIGGTNTKINYVTVAPSSESNRPSVASVTPANGSTDMLRNTFVAAEVHLPNVGYGIDAATLTSATVKLVRTSDGAPVPANLNTSGGGDVIVLQPTVLLAATTSYTFQVTDGLKDLSGAAFFPYTSAFTTGTAGGVTDDSIAFDKVALPTATNKLFSSLTLGPDDKLYAATLEGEIVRFPVNGDGTLGAAQVLSSLQTANGGNRMLIGLAFDPSATASNLVLWVSHGAFAFNNAPDWSGKISRLSGPNLETVTDYVVNLPRSIRDHMTNSLAFGPDDALYVLQGSNTAMGAPDDAWGLRPEHLLSSALLRVDLAAITSPPLDVKTAEGGTYDPRALDAPVTVYASGIRNAYDLVFHSNGQLYVPTNGSAAGGSTPATPDPLPTSCQDRLDDAANGDYTGPQVPGISDAGSAHSDLLFRVVPGGYYGHPNPERCEWVMNGGNPTAEGDAGEVGDYPVGVAPDRNWRGFAFDFGIHYSPNGVIEYKANKFGGALIGKLLVARYSAGDDIIVLTPGGPNLDIVSGEAGFSGLTGFKDPLDLAQNSVTGDLYLSELGAQKITLLRPKAGPNIVLSTSRIVVNDVQGGAPSPAHTVTISNTGNAPLTIGSLALTGPNANQFEITAAPSLPASVQPGATAAVDIVFNPTSAGPKGAFLEIGSDDPGTPTSTVSLRGLGTLGLGGSNEPSLQWILDTYEIPANVGDPDPTTSALPSDPLLGEEVDIELFQKAGTGPVAVEALAVFGPSATDPVVRFGWYPQGNTAGKQELFSISNAHAQKVNPPLTGATTFDPGRRGFGLFSIWPFFSNREVFSEDSLNTWEPTVANRHKVRVYPLKEKTGTVVPNAYVVATEEHTTGYDYQDVVVIVRNVKAATKAEIELANLDVIPYADRLAFSRIGSLTSPPADIVHDKATLRIKNTGIESLVVSGLPIIGPWEIMNPPTLPVSVAAGGQLDLTVRFISACCDVNTGTLTINSDDADEPSTGVQLAGFWQSVSEGGQEPGLAEVLSVFGYTTTILKSGQVLNQKGLVTPVGDEILSPYWRRANTAAPVTVRQLDAFHNQNKTATIRWHVKGSTAVETIFTHLSTDGQTVLPRKGTATLASGTFTPTSAVFGLKVDGEWSDPTLNNQTTDSGNGCVGPCGHHVRFWPAKDRAGATIPNTWILAMDYSGINYDYNDNVYLISNVKPEYPPLLWSASANSPIVRSEAQAAAVGGKLYVFGGHIDSTFKPTVRSDVYDPATNTWTPIADMPVALTHAGTAVDGTDVYLAGGYPATATSQTFSTTDVWKYNVATNSWSAMPSLPAARGGGALALAGRNLHFFGGADASRVDKADHWVLSLDGGTSWTTAAAMPAARNHLAGASLGGLVYAIGGQSGQDESSITRSSNFAFNPATGTWATKKALPSARSHIAGATIVWDNRIWVLGGERMHATNVNYATAYEPGFNLWTTYMPLPFARRSSIAGAIGSEIVYGTGAPLTGAMVKGGFALG